MAALQNTELIAVVVVVVDAAAAVAVN